MKPPINLYEKKGKPPSENDQRSVWTQEGVYSKETISHLPSQKDVDYNDTLLKFRLDLVRQYAAGSILLDVCCASGQHLLGFGESMQAGVGVDFSLPYLEKANENKKDHPNTTASFLCSDAKKIPNRSHYFDVAYSFSSLHIVPDVQLAILEMARVLKTGGKCILDLGNMHSLNAAVIKNYNQELGWAKPFLISIRDMKKYIHAAGMKIIEHRAFQVLPLWGANRPKRLKLFLLPFWTRLLSKQISGKMIDEWISNTPIIKNFAFRHVFVCEKV